MASTTRLTEDFIDKFNIIEIIEQKAKSGQKQVFIVNIDGKLVALKIIPSIGERIVRELKIYDEFKENNGIPCILKVEKYGNELVVLEEFIEGSDLQDVRDDYMGDSSKVRTLIYSICEILKPVWEKRYVHRDIKPQNIIIKTDGSPVILDFGIARDLEDETITPTGFQPFSWPFASPEQYFYKKDQISYRTDFFCLGIIAFYLYTGILPFGQTKFDIAKAFQDVQKVFSFDDELMNNFFNVALKYKAAERPRNIDTYIKSLGI